MGHSHGADRVADSTPVGAVIGAVNGLNEHGSVVHGEADSPSGTKQLAILSPHSGADGAGGLAGEVSGVFIFYQDGLGALDGGSSYQRWQGTKRVKALKMVRYS